MRRTFAILALLAAGLAAQPAVSGDAAPVMLGDAEHRAWRAIGRVNVAGFDAAGTCTGTLITPDTVLTAAHCLHALRGRNARPGQVHFVAGWHRDGFAAVRTARAIRLHPGYVHGKRPDSKTLQGDLALILLSGPIPSDEVRPIPLALPETVGPKVDVIGYRRDRLNALSRHANCPVAVESAGLLGLGCTVTQGTSGAPVLIRTAQGWRVVGVVSAGVSGAGPIRTAAARPTAAFLRGE
ncbi:trypsin-like serine peptidase [Rhodovulum euryhalinum]|uniref:V8-like Glu-specific endopeptidase n=1 Tax=Rhodovulum euryhalinum TaxID=35805 RepID=A0A4R2KBS5_9RHOB|nr:trypsin-like serine protease [Rhodovulum euryhalinum]TCO70951.1 V8-like Glu-specific endopeptidase [Rhodovulum euryhalinum]